MQLEIMSRRVKAGFVLTGTVAAAVAFGSTAYAQAWLPDRTYTEGPGIRAGDLEIHPGVAVRGGYDTNVFRADGDHRSAVVNGTTTDVTQKRQGAPILAVTPHIHLSTLSAQRREQGEDRETQKALPPVAFRGGLAATYYQYFLTNAPKNLAVDTDLWLGILPGRPVNADVTLAYARNVRPFTQNAHNKNAYNNDVIQPRLRLNFGSRSQVLTSYVGYAPRVTIFESPVFNYLNNFAHAIEGGAAWRFLPSTALVYDVNLDLQDYKKDDSTQSRSPVLFSNSQRFRTRLGINGAVTRTLSVRALAGYAAIAFDNKNGGARLDDHEDVVGEAALTLAFGPGKAGQFETGYQRDVQSSFMGGWFRSDRGYMNVRSLIGRVFQIGLETGVSRIRYGSLWGFDRSAGVGSAQIVPLGSGNDLARKDIRLDAAVHGELRVTNWLSFMADVAVQAVLTDFNYAVYTSNASPIPDPARYYTVSAFGGVRAHY